MDFDQKWIPSLESVVTYFWTAALTLILFTSQMNCPATAIPEADHRPATEPSTRALRPNHLDAVANLSSKNASGLLMNRDLNN